MKTTLRLLMVCLILVCLIPVFSLSAQADTQISDSPEDPISINRIVEYTTGYHEFTSFMDLENLILNCDYIHTLVYVGEGDFRFSRSLSTSRDFKIIFEECKVKIPEGVSVQMNECRIYAHEMLINGQLDADYLEVTNSLIVNGTLNITSSVRLVESASLSGRENIHGTDYEIRFHFMPGTEAELYDALNIIPVYSDDEHVYCIIETKDGSSFVIDQDITIPESTPFYFSSYHYPDNSFTLNEGCTMTVNGGVTLPRAFINGTVINNGLVALCSTALFADDSCYNGYGMIEFTSDHVDWREPYVDYPKDTLIGLDLSRFQISFSYDDESVYYYYSACLRTCMPHSFSGGVCTICGLDRNIATIHQPDGVYRLAGATRVETALKSADLLKETLQIETFDNIIVANARNYPDALAGSYLAACLKAPILLTMDGYHDMVYSFISKNLSADGTVYILGGYTAVPEEFNKHFMWHTQYVRLAGKDRFDTNLKILNTVGIGEEPLLVCTAYGFADSLSVAATGYPVLLVGNRLTGEQKEFLSRSDLNEVYLVGGTAAVSATIEQEMQMYSSSVKRLAGKDRHETSVLVAEEFFSGADNAILAYSQNFPDGLSGGPLAYCLRAPLLLTKAGNMTCAPYCEDNQIHTGVIMGSDELIDDSTAHILFQTTYITVR